MDHRLAPLGGLEVLEQVALDLQAPTHQDFLRQLVRIVLHHRSGRTIHLLLPDQVQVIHLLVAQMVLHFLLAPRVLHLQVRARARQAHHLRHHQVLALATPDSVLQVVAPTAPRVLVHQEEPLELDHPAQMDLQAQFHQEVMGPTRRAQMGHRAVALLQDLTVHPTVVVVVVVVVVATTDQTHHPHLVLEVRDQQVVREAQEVQEVQDLLVLVLVADHPEATVRKDRRALGLGEMLLAHRARQRAGRLAQRAQLAEAVVVLILWALAQLVLLARVVDRKAGLLERLELAVQGLTGHLGLAARMARVLALALALAQMQDPLEAAVAELQDWDLGVQRHQVLGSAHRPGPEEEERIVQVVDLVERITTALALGLDRDLSMLPVQALVMVMAPTRRAWVIMALVLETERTLGLATTGPLAMELILGLGMALGMVTVQAMVTALILALEAASAAATATELQPVMARLVPIQPLLGLDWGRRGQVSTVQQEPVH